MTVEILFGEVCNLFGDMQNMQYLRETLPQAEFIETSLLDEPYFVKHTPGIIYMGAMTEHTQRRVIEKLRPYKDRLTQLSDAGNVMLFTGNAGEVFFKHISYVTEKIETDALGLFDLTVKTDLFQRYNGKVLGELRMQNAECGDPCPIPNPPHPTLITGFRSQFSRWYGDNSENYFLKVQRGMGLNEESKREGVRKNNLICTTVIGPILPNNPLFTEYLCALAGNEVKAAHRETAIRAWEQRLKEMQDPAVKF